VTHLPVGVVTRLPIGVVTHLPVGVAMRLPVCVEAHLPVCVEAHLPIGVAARLPVVSCDGANMCCLSKVKPLINYLNLEKKEKKGSGGTLDNL
jgi:hypothetical protein